MRWFVVLVFIIAGVYFLFGRDTETKNQITFQTGTITRGDLHVSVAAAGTLEPTNVVTIGSEVSGTISDVLVDVNDRVTKEQLLVQIDTSTLQDMIEKSAAALTASKAYVVQAEATLKERQASFARQRELARLSNNRLPSKADLDATRATVTRAEADLESAKAAVAQAEATLRSNETSLAKASIRSPIDGVVLSRSVDPGQTVAASFSAPKLMEIAEDLSKMELQVYVDEADVGQIKEGQDATFTVDAWPNRTYSARITRVSFGATQTGNVVSYKTTLIVDNADLSLRPGMTASAVINTASRTNALLVPNAALRFSPPEPEAEEQSSSILASLLPRPRFHTRSRSASGGKEGGAKNIWTLENGVPVPLSVTVGMTNGTLTEISGEKIREGLNVITGSTTMDGK